MIVPFLFFHFFLPFDQKFRFINTSFTTPTPTPITIMPPFLPPEILGMVIFFIFDIETLLALRLVNRVWRDAVDNIPGQLLYVDILNKNLARLDSVSHTENLRKNVRTLVLNLPDRPIWNVSTPCLTQYSIRHRL